MGARPPRRPMTRSTRAIAPPEQPAITAPRAWASTIAAQTALPVSGLEHRSGLAAREVDEVGLADRLGEDVVVGRGPVEDARSPRPRPRARRSARSPGRPSGRDPPSPSAKAAVGTMTTRGRRRPVVARRSASKAAISGRKAPAPTSATGPDTGRVYPSCPPEPGTSPWRPHGDARHARIGFGGRDPAGRATRDESRTLDDARGDPRIGLGLPRLDGRQRRPLQDRQGAAGDPRRRPRGPDVHRRAATSRRWPRSSSWPARWPTTTAGAGSSRSAWPRSAFVSVLCGLAPTLELLILFRVLQGATGALLVPCSLSIITATFEGAGPGPGVRHLGGGDVGDLDPRAARRRGLRRLVHVAAGVPHQRPDHPHRPLRDAPPHGRVARRGVARPVRLARRGGRGARGRRPRVRGHPRPGQAVARHARVRRARASGIVGTIAFPFLMARRPNPLVPLIAVPVARLLDHQPLDAARVRRALRHLRVHDAVPAGRARLLAPSGPP